MRLFRIAKTRYINDLSGAGARTNGGRWNRVGVGLLYTSPSRALATVEYLVHVPLARVPKNLSIATIAVPDDAPAETITEEMLPNNWRRHPAPVELEEIGTCWIEERRSLLLRVPSAVVKGDYNVLVNPAHSEMQGVEIAAVEPYLLDERLVR
ncbi:MAG: RES family NAD+ phosphorylase [Gemmatimonadetes bacterium]|nr:RES family NAD+ phosphorylase [Gemmatimonadota bacterium]MXY84854.1 RES family NAD+ phosphorylase [Gemmatimonadota bacterium]MYB67647.1 RES family NAD+ phosphorylase [Gemmatimonadota bacterium]